MPRRWPPPPPSAPTCSCWVRALRASTGPSRASELGARVTLVTKGSLQASNSYMAQGGVAAAVGPGDSFEQHAADTLAVGRGLGDPAAVRLLAEEGIDRIRDLERMGVRFDRGDDGAYRLGREGGHGRRRILHAGGARHRGRDRGGADRARRGGSATSPSWSTRPHSRSRAAATPAPARGCSATTSCGLVRARMTLLATGGACALYARTTNPPGATGDGIALAHRAGAAVRDMEFVQFHPTALAGSGRAFLISEAVRGEGAWLVDAGGRRFMTAAHPDAELAPRDVVTRSIEALLAEGGRAYLTPPPSRSRAGAAPLRQHRRRVRRGGARPVLRSHPGRPRRPLPDGRSRHRPRRGHHHPRPLRLRRVRGDRRARRESACVQLAARVLRLRPSRRRAGLDAATAAARADAGPPPGRPQARAPLPELARRMWAGAGPVRDEDGLQSLAAWIADQPRSNPMLVAGADRRRRPAPHREPRGAPAQRLPRHRPGPGQEQRMSTASLDGVIDRALEEDAGRGDPTTAATVPAELMAVADVVVREPGVVCGLEIAPRGGAAARPATPRWRCWSPTAAPSRRRPRRSPGSRASARALLTAERTALNVLQRMSGIATATRGYVGAVDGHRRRDPRHAQDRARACARWTSSPSPAAAAPTTAPTWPPPS